MLGSRIVVNHMASLLPGGWWVGFFEFVSIGSTPYSPQKTPFFARKANKSDESDGRTKFCTLKFDILKRRTQIKRY